MIRKEYFRSTITDEQNNVRQEEIVEIIKFLGIPIEKRRSRFTNEKMKADSKLGFHGGSSINRDR